MEISSIIMKNNSQLLVNSTTGQTQTFQQVCNIIEDIRNLAGKL